MTKKSSSLTNYIAYIFDFILFTLLIQHKKSSGILHASDDFHYFKILSVIPSQIFFPCGKSAPYVPFGLIYLQHLPHRAGKVGIELFHPVGNVLVYRGLAYAKPLRGLPHR